MAMKKVLRIKILSILRKETFKGKLVKGSLQLEFVRPGPRDCLVEQLVESPYQSIHFLIAEELLLRKQQVFRGWLHPKKSINNGFIFAFQL